MVASAHTIESEAVTLDVTDLDRSGAFYATYFGLAPGGPVGHGRLLVSQADESVGPITLKLRHCDRVVVHQELGIEVDDASEVLDLYLLMILSGLRATLPRTAGGRLTTVVIDPDGHRVAVWARAEQSETNHTRRESTRGVQGWMRSGTSPRQHERAARDTAWRARAG